jgi:hypothetical protein
MTLRPLTILEAGAERAARTDTLLKLGEGAVHAQPVGRTVKACALRGNGARRLALALALGVLCVVGGAVPSLGSDTCPPPGPPGGDPSCQPQFNLNGYDKGAKTPINTCQTNEAPYTSSCAWADVSTDSKNNFLACSLQTTGPIALCYYSGVPGAPNFTPSCTFSQDKNSAECDCYKIGQDTGATYSYILITSILNKDVYEETVAQCGSDGSECLNLGNMETNPKPEAQMLCAALGNKTFFPGADLISDFSPILDTELNPDSSLAVSCPTSGSGNLYAGCMTAPCKNTGKIDSKTGLPLVKCTCPTYYGPNQVGNPVQINSSSCSPTPYVWSSRYMPPAMPTQR